MANKTQIARFLKDAGVEIKPAKVDDRLAQTAGALLKHIEGGRIPKLPQLLELREALQGALPAAGNFDVGAIQDMCVRKVVEMRRAQRRARRPPWAPPLPDPEPNA